MPRNVVISSGSMHARIGKIVFRRFALGIKIKGVYRLYWAGDKLITNDTGKFGNSVLVKRRKVSWVILVWPG